MNKLVIASLFALSWVGHAGDGNVVIGNGYVVDGNQNLAIGNNGQVIGDDNVQIGDSSSITGNGNFQAGNNQQLIGSNQYQNNFQPQNSPTQSIYPPNIYSMGSPGNNFVSLIPFSTGLGVPIYQIVTSQPTIDGQAQKILSQRVQFFNSPQSTNLRIQPLTGN